MMVDIDLDIFFPVLFAGSIILLVVFSFVFFPVFVTSGDLFLILFIIFIYIMFKKHYVSAKIKKLTKTCIKCGHEKLYVGTTDGSCLALIEVKSAIQKEGSKLVMCGCPEFISGVK